MYTRLNSYPLLEILENGFDIVLHADVDPAVFSAENRRILMALPCSASAASLRGRVETSMHVMALYLYTGNGHRRGGRDASERIVSVRGDQKV